MVNMLSLTDRVPYFTMLISANNPEIQFGYYIKPLELPAAF